MPAPHLTPGTTELTFTRHTTRAEAAAALQFFITHDGS